MLVCNQTHKHCPSISIPNPLGAGSLDCIGTPINLSADPNDKSGTQGVTAAQFHVGGMPPSYTIRFESDPEKANAPAQEVVITDQLDASRVDLDTFELGAISFGSFVLPVSPGVQHQQCLSRKRLQRRRRSERRCEDVRGEGEVGAHLGPVSSTGFGFCL